MGTATMSRSLFGGTVGVSGGPADASQAAEGLLEEEEVVFGDPGDDDLNRRLEGLGVGLTDDGDGLGLYHLVDASVICGGRVGGGADHRICLKADGECLAATHHASRDEDLLADLVGKVLVRTKPGGGAKAACASPSIGYAEFSAYGGAVDMLNSRKPRRVWATIFGELEKGGDLVKPLVEMAAIATQG